MKSLRKSLRKSPRNLLPLAAILFFGACRGVTGLDELSFSDEGGASSSSSSGGGVCDPGAAEACEGAYSGPPGTEGVGLCKGPSRACYADGTGFGQCEGEVVPQAEDCSTLGDESCDGNGACDGASLWGKPFGDGANVEICGLAVDSSENLVLAGHFKGTINLGGSDFKSFFGKSVFVAKLGADGAHIWSRAVTGAVDQVCSGVAVGSFGNVILGGFYVGGSPDFGGGPLPPANSYDGFYAKLGADSGEHVWSGAVGGAGDQTVRGVGIDNAGFVFIVGRYQNPITIGQFTLVPTEQNETFVARIDSDAVPLLAKRFWASGALHGMKIAVDKGTGAAVIAGQIVGSGAFGNTMLSGSADDQDSFLVGLDPFGEVLWATSLVGPNRQQVNGLAFDGAGGVLVAGEFEGIVDFAGIPLIADGLDGFVMRLDGTGKATWAVPVSGLGNQTVSSVAVGGGGDVLAAGTFGAQIELGPYGQAGAGNNDAFVAKLDPGAGAPIWLRVFGSLSSESAGAVASDSLGNAAVSGKYSGDLDLGLKDGPLTVSEGDAFIVKVAP